MSDSVELGKIGEQLAAEYLKKTGYAILALNYKSKSRAEVDIIASKEGQIIFVEVKTRKSDYLNAPALMVPLRKQKQIMKAANSYIEMHNIKMPWRLDIISIVLNKKDKKIEHFEDAFYPTL